MRRPSRAKAKAPARGHTKRPPAPSPGTTFEKAIMLVKAGGELRRHAWPPHHYLCVLNQPILGGTTRMFVRMGIRGEGRWWERGYSPSQEDMLTDDWALHWREK